jgi:hypothetical protein
VDVLLHFGVLQCSTRTSPYTSPLLLLPAAARLPVFRQHLRYGHQAFGSLPAQGLVRGLTVELQEQAEGQAPRTQHALAATQQHAG